MFNLKKKKKETPENINQLAEKIEELEKENAEIKGKLDEICKRGETFLQNVKVVRFNPFSDSGGNQSFSVAVLDSSGNGAVITSLYSSGGNRVYAKPVKGGVSEYSLSREEKNAIEGALKDEEQHE